MAPAKQVALLPPFSFQLLLVTAQSAEEEDDEESEGEDHQENEKKWESIGDAEGQVQITVGKSGGGNVDAIEQAGIVYPSEKNVKENDFSQEDYMIVREGIDHWVNQYTKDAEGLLESIEYLNDRMGLPRSTTKTR